MTVSCVVTDPHAFIILTLAFYSWWWWRFILYCWDIYCFLLISGDLFFCCCSFSGNLLIVLFENLVCSFCCSYKVEILVSIPFVGLDVVIATRTDRSSGEDSSIVTIFISLLSQIISFWLVVALFTCPTASSSFCRSLYISQVLQLFSHCNLELAGRHRLWQYFWNTLESQCNPLQLNLQFSRQTHRLI